jgi:hypothetical protein
VESTDTFSVLLAELDQPGQLKLLHRIQAKPESFRRGEPNRDITEAAATCFTSLAAQLLKAGHEPEKISQFLRQCQYCFLAEEVGLLPNKLFTKLINAKLDLPSRQGLLPSQKLAIGLASLFTSMHSGEFFGWQDIPRFNAGLFKAVDVPRLDAGIITELRNAAGITWSAVDVSMFGELTGRGQDRAPELVSVHRLP